MGNNTGKESEARAEKDKEHKRNCSEAKTSTWKEAEAERRSEGDKETLQAFKNLHPEVATTMFTKALRESILEDKVRKIENEVQRQLKETQREILRRWETEEMQMEIFRQWKIEQMQRKCEETRTKTQKKPWKALIERIRLSGKLPWKFPSF